VLRPERIELLPDGEIVYKNVFGRKKLHTDQLKGFRIRQGNLCAWSDLSCRPQLFASWLTFDRREQVYEWFQQRVENLDLRDVNQETELLKQALSEATEGEMHELLRWNSRLGRLAGVLFVILFVTMLLGYNNPWVQNTHGLLLLLTQSIALLWLGLLWRHRTAVTIDTQAQILVRPAVVLPALLLCTPILAVLQYPPLDAPSPLIFGLFSLPVAILVAMLPAAPDVRIHQRLLLGAMMVFFMGYFPQSLNMSLALWPERTRYDATITELGSGSENHARWRLAQPIPAFVPLQGSTHRIPKGLCVGGHLQVEVSHGAFGWHWISGHYFQEDDPVCQAGSPPLMTHQRCRKEEATGTAKLPRQEPEFELDFLLSQT
jgi:hypothetical protein